LELYFREFGEGRPLVILHGLFGFSDNWQTVAKALSDQYLVITPDLRNHGRSPHTTTHSYPEMAEDLFGFLEDRWVFSSVVMGHSMGGKVAMQFALTHPDMVERLIVVDMDPVQVADHQQTVFKALLSVDFEVLNTRQLVEAHLTQWIDDVGTRQFLLKNVTRDEDNRLSWKMNLDTIWRDYANVLAPLESGVFDKPALFIRGANSNYIADADWPVVLQYFPQATLVTIEGAGHWVHADQPQALIEAVRQFLQQA
jgi:esterase